jgi:molybdopterin converting factor small subunit
MSDIVSIRLPRRLQKSLGKKDWFIELKQTRTLEWVIQHLAKECDPSFNELLNDTSHRPGWIESIVLNSQMVRLPQDLQLQVTRGDKLFFFEPVSGG